MTVLDALDPFAIATPPRDLEFNFLGNIVLCTPLTDEGTQWIEEHVDPASLWYGHSLVVEPRFVDDLVAGATSDGLACGAS
jgi:hypothetical protein